MQYTATNQENMSQPKGQQYHRHLKEYYDRQSTVYAATYTGEGRYPTGYHRLWISLAMIDEMQPQPQVVIDAGCGDARMVVELSKRGIACTGFDISEGMLEMGRKLLQENNLPIDSIQSGDIYNIPAKDQTVDLLLSLGVLENLDRHGDLFKEFRRVLKPGGKVLFSVENHLFSLFTFNQHTLRFLKSLFEDIKIPPDIRDDVIHEIGSWLHLEDIQQIERIIEDRQIHKENADIPKYNRLNVDSELRIHGFQTERLRFYHVHPIPPRLEKKYPDLFREFAEKLETSEYDWRSTLLCNCMLVQASPL